MADWFEKITFGALPDRAAKKFGDREALYYKGHRWSFIQLAEDINRAAKGLIQLGVQPGEHVSIWVPNRPEFIHLFFALAKIGAVVVPVNTFLRTADTAYMLSQSNSSTLITVDQSGPIDYLAMVHEMIPSIKESSNKELSLKEFPDLKRVVILSEKAYEGTYSWSEILVQGEPVSDESLGERSDAVDPDGTVLIMYTSGTTGFPKGVMHCHNLIRNITDKANRLTVTFEDITLMYLPLFHAFGLYEGPFMSVITGSRQVLTETFDPHEGLALIEQERVTMLHGFDTHFKDLIESQETAGKDVSSLRTGLLASGMSSSVPIAQKAQRVLCSGLASAYGMSEIGVGACVSYLSSTEEQRTEASGYPLPGYDIRVVDPITGEDQPEGAQGEILVKAYMVMQGYYNKPEETAKTIDKDGWLHTGDMGVIRPDGRLRFMGRFKEMLKTGGENVDPMEVEAYLCNHPAIHQVAIVGYPDERLSEVGVAFVQLKPDQNLTGDEVINYCKGKIATFKIPRHVILIEDYPMTASGKIKKVVLKEMAVEQLK